jgi:hypothetical protein
MQARRSSLYVKPTVGPYFYDDFTTGTDGNIAGQAASQAGSWIAVSSSPGNINKTISGTYIHSSDASLAINLVELIPAAGRGVSYDKIRVKGSYYIRNSGAIYNNLLAVSVFNAPGNARSGVRINLYNPSASNGCRLQATWYSAGGTGSTEYASGDTEMPVNTVTPFEFVYSRLPGNIVEVSVSINNIIKVNALQFTVGANISAQDSIIVELRNTSSSSDTRIIGPLLVDDQDIGS